MDGATPRGHDVTALKGASAFLVYLYKCNSAIILRLDAPSRKVSFMITAPLLPRQPATLELAPIGNCTVSALVDQSGSIVWCCMPRFDSSPVFDALLQSAQGLPLDGAMTVELESLARIEQAYDRGTAIVRTRLWDDSGNGIETVDFAPRFLTRDRVFRPAQLVRRVRPLAGHPRVRFVVRPSGDWGATLPTLTRGSHHLRYNLPGLTLRLNTSVPLTYVIDGTWFTLQAPVSLLLGPDETLAGGIDETAREFEEQTALYWRHLDAPPGPAAAVAGRRDPRAITLKLCQYEDTGAIVAALTTSIPEAPHSGATGTTATAGCATPSSWCVRSTACPRSARWRLPAMAVQRGARAPAAATCSRCTASAGAPPAERFVPQLPGLPRHGPGARGQPGARTFPARRLRQHRARRGAGLPRPPPAGARRRADFPPARGDGRAGLAPARPARRRHLGAAHPRPRAHLVGADVLGRLRPAGASIAARLGLPSARRWAGSTRRR
jgi:hypothetical protein